MSFAGACLAVGKHGPIKTLHHTINNLSYWCVEDLLLGCFVVEDSVKVVLNLAAAAIFADAIYFQRFVI